ncbi:hypothetical protein ACWELV_30185, partial [Streptomyces mirabilis]
MEPDIEAGLWSTQSKSCRCGWAGGWGAAGGQGFAGRPTDATSTSVATGDRSATSARTREQIARIAHGTGQLIGVRRELTVADVEL